MTRGAAAAVVTAAVWALMFGDPRTDGVGWKQVDEFGSQASCLEERQERAREVQEKTATTPPLETVVHFYRCVRLP